MKLIFGTQSLPTQQEDSCQKMGSHEHLPPPQTYYKDFPPPEKKQIIPNTPETRVGPGSRNCTLAVNGTKAPIGNCKYYK